MEQNNSKYIKYDLHEYIIYRRYALGAFILFFIDMGICSYTWVNITLFKLIIGCFFHLLLPFFLIIFIIFFILYLSCKKYFRYLRWNDYQIPYNKKNYNCIVENLPKNENDSWGEEFKCQDNAVAKTLAIITAVLFITSFIITKTPHFIISAIMLIVTIYYFKQTSNTYCCGEFDKEEEVKAFLPKRKKIKFAEALIIMGALTFCFVSSDRNFPVTNPLFYNQAMRYYKAIEPEKYKLFMDKLPANAEDVEFYALGTEQCVVYYESDAGYYNFNQLENVEIAKDGLSQEEHYDLMMEIHGFIPLPKMWGAAEDYVIYKYVPPVSEENIDYNWFAIVHRPTGEVVLGFVD